MIRRCEESDLESILSVINDGAEAYRGIIPADRFSEPYMLAEELAHEVADGVSFWGYDLDGKLAGVMGVQDKGEVALIRHAYVRTGAQRRGIGAHLLSHLRVLTPLPVLIGTWADAVWAIRFYETHGFRVVSAADKELLLRRYWHIPERQVETSVVLADERGRSFPVAP